MEFQGGRGPGGPTEVRFPQFKGLPKLPLGQLRVVILIALAAVLVLSSFYTVSAEEVGVVLRFGQYVRESPPGLHFKMPLGVEEVIKVPVTRQLKQELGYRTKSAAIQSQLVRSNESGLESKMLTGDLNGAVVEWVIQYRITEPYKYLFRVRNVDETLRDMSEAVMREVIGDRTVNEVITVGRGEVEVLASEKLQSLCDQYESGINVDQIVLQVVTPPEPVRPSYDEVNEAEQELDRLRNEAEAEYNKVIPRARGEAEQQIKAAEGYAIDRVNRSKGEAARFNALYAEYRKAPEVTRKRIYLETLGEVLTKAGSKTVIDSDLDSVLPFLDVGAAKVTRDAAKGGS